MQRIEKGKRQVTETGRCKSRPQPGRVSGRGTGSGAVMEILWVKQHNPPTIASRFDDPLSTGLVQSAPSGMETVRLDGLFDFVSG